MQCYIYYKLSSPSKPRTYVCAGRSPGSSPHYHLVAGADMTGPITEKLLTTDISQQPQQREKSV